MQLDEEGKIIINSSNCIPWSLSKDNLYTDIYNLTPGGVQDREIKFPYLVLFTVFSFYFSLNTFVLFTFQQAFSHKLFSIAEVNSRFIDIHPCLGNILNVFHNKIV
jgi:hypothetical protein